MRALSAALTVLSKLLTHGRDIYSLYNYTRACRNAALRHLLATAANATAVNATLADCTCAAANATAPKIKKKKKKKPMYKCVGLLNHVFIK